MNSLPKSKTSKNMVTKKAEILLPVAHDKRHLVDEKYSLRSGNLGYTEQDRLAGVDWGQTDE